MKFKDAIGNFGFVDNWYSYSVNLVLAQILNEADLYSEKKNILGARV